MASPRYIAYLKGLLLDSHGTVETLTSYFDELIELNGPSLVLADLLQGKNQELRATVLYHIGELWLSGKHVSANTAKLLPALASAHDSETVFDLTHAIDKLIRARRYGDTDEPIPTYIVECLSTMAHAPYQEFAERARRTLRRIRRRRTLGL
jgi:hypothetical protein